MAISDNGCNMMQAVNTIKFSRQLSVTVNGDGTVRIGKRLMRIPVKKVMTVKRMKYFRLTIMTG